MSIRTLLLSLGIQSEWWVEFLNIIIILAIYGLIAWGVYIVIKKWLSKLVFKIASRTSAKWDDVLLDQKFFNRLGLLMVPIILQIGLSMLEWKHMEDIVRLVNVWIIFASVWLINAFLDGVNRVYEKFSISKDKPIKVFIQVVMIFLYCAAVMIVISIYTGESVAALLGGLAAFAAVLMLIFKDSILGLVAGVQLSANNMVRIGDWIQMPSSGADGDVIEINLITVKVQNWDKTITTIPTYKLVSDSFTNWRGMEESNGRRIKRSVNIDVDTIHYLTDEEIERLEQSDLLRDYMKRKVSELAEYNANRKNLLDERRMTNIGTFREYLEEWLSHNPDINLDMTHMVRQLQPGPTGLPLEIYCFSARQKWIDYERVQSDIFDHVFAVMDLFGLRAFEFSGGVPPERLLEENKK